LRKAGAVAALAACLATLGAPQAFAKEKKVASRTVSGAVLDEADNGIAGAMVELTDLQTGKKVAIYSQEGGEYRFADLRLDHDYQVRASLHGASSPLRTVSSVDTRTRIVINLTIPKKKPS
jgi:hypothetical protein